MTDNSDSVYDVLVIGGGINGAGIAHDAASRGLRVMLCEQSDLGSATSSASSKLIHGGLRYLEYYEFKLVREALKEREVLMRVARHLVRPMRFVLPHVGAMRPAWMIRIGLYLYDHLSRSISLPRSYAVSLRSEWGQGLKPEFKRGFVYSDCWVDDARLVVANAVSAHALGADIRVRCEVTGAVCRNGVWIVTVRDTNTNTLHHHRSRTLINAAGPWVSEVLRTLQGATSNNRVRLVKGSHIVVPRVHAGDHAFTLQNDDRRVVFVLPFEDAYSLIGTTDTPVDAPTANNGISDAEVDYLCAATSRYLARPVAAGDVIWTYSGVRPLFDDGERDPSKVTRDYVLEMITTEDGGPVLNVYGGKLTTYRHLAETVVERLRPYFARWRPSRTATLALAGSDFDGVDPTDYYDEIQQGANWLAPADLKGVLRRHGTRAEKVLESATAVDDLGQRFGATLYQREVDFLIEHEWAQTGDDILWRRTKCGLHMSRTERETVNRYVAQRSGSVATVCANISS